MRKITIIGSMLVLLITLLSGCANNDIHNSQTEIANLTSNAESGYETVDVHDTELYYEWDYGGDGGYDHGRFRINFFSLPAAFVDLVGSETYQAWWFSRCVEERENESVAVSFIRYFNISRADFERANEERRQFLLTHGLSAEVHCQSAELFPVDLIFTFDNEKINEFFRWRNSPRIESRALEIYPETVIPSVAIEVEVPIAGARVEQQFPLLGSRGAIYRIETATWSSNISPFGADASSGKTVTAIISARTGYTLRGLQSATINGNPAVISNNTGITARISYTFTDEAPQNTNHRIAAGSTHTLAIMYDGTVWAWGLNHRGQLGDNTILRRLTPVQTQNLTNVISVAAGMNHSLALRADGTVWAWGDNVFGQIGDNTTLQRRMPVQTRNLSNIVAIAAGDYHSIALRDDGTVWTWGSNMSGQLGDGTAVDSRNTPAKVQNLNNIIAITAGTRHTLALRDDGTIWAWGSNSRGQLGIGSWPLYRNVPVQAHNMANFINMAAGIEHTITIRDDNTVWGWGLNVWGQLGIGFVTDTTLPTQVRNLINAVDITAGRNHTIILREDGVVLATGLNMFGQLGDGTDRDRNMPVRLWSIQDIIEISACWGHTIALKDDGTVWTWGWNYNGELGDGTTTGRRAPVQVRGPGGVGFLNLFEGTSTQGERMNASDLANDVMHYMHSWAVEDTSIKNAIVDVMSPAAGAEPSQFSSAIGNVTVGAVVWSTDNSVFTGNTRYTVKVTLVADEGFSFTELNRTLINGHSAIVVENTGDTVTLSFEFPETEIPFHNWRR